jgi:excisionase family DNA binding protein
MTHTVKQNSYEELPGLISELKNQQGVAAIAVRFTLLTVTRANEVLGATWGEIDLDKMIWTLPGLRMKVGRPHRVPLSDFAFDVLSRLEPSRAADRPILSDPKIGRPISHMALLATMRRTRPHLRVHGFRSAFRDWAAANTDFSDDVAEAVLGHSVAGHVGEDRFEERRRLLNAWGQFTCSDCKPPAHPRHPQGPQLRQQSGQDERRKFLTIRAACHRYACGKTTIYELIKSGDLVARKLGTKTIIDGEVADQFFNALPSKTN